MTNRKETQDVISIINSRLCAKIPVKQIEAVEQEASKLHIITSDHEYEVYESIETIAPILLENDFYRVMKKVIINFDLVREISNQMVKFYSGSSYRIGRNNYYELKRAFKEYLRRFPPYFCQEQANELEEQVFAAEDETPLNENY